MALSCKFKMDRESTFGGYQMPDHSQDSDNASIEPNALYIGQGVSVKGDISVPNIVVVDGSVEGNVTGRAIWVGPSGAIKGKIVATEAEIHGMISEKIEVKQLLLIHATGRVAGEVCYGELQIEKGAIISGAFSSIDLESDKKESKVEQVLGKPERPPVIRRIEPNRARNGASMHTKIPAADFRDAS
jgi:cytoskeletal protein CcmA (bactofilin family)